MAKPSFSDVRELLKKAFSIRDSTGVFNKMPKELPEAYFKHCVLLECMELARLKCAGAEERERLAGIIENLEANLREILASIGSLTERTIIPCDTEEGDTLWKISKRFASELNEIMLLNNIDNVILPLGKSRLLIPLKNNQD